MTLLGKFWGAWSSFKLNPTKDITQRNRRQAIARACFGTLEGLEGRQLMSISIDGFTLINADNDTVITPLKNGAVIDMAALPTRNVTIRADKNDAVESTRFALDGNPNFHTDNSYPYSMSGGVRGDYYRTALANGPYTLTATPYTGNDAMGEIGRARSLSFSVVNSTASAPAQAAPSATSATSATYVRSDTTRRGNWRGVYGSEGHIVLGDSSRVPAYARVTPSHKSDYLWTDRYQWGNELQRASGSGYVAATWYAPNSFDVNVNITDGRQHQVTMYFVDYGSTARRQKVEVIRASDGAILDTKYLSSSFSGGVYHTWKVSGDVRFRITRTGGANAVMSGIFFDPASATATPTAPVASAPITSPATSTPTTPTTTTPTISGLAAPSQALVNSAIAQPLIRYNRSIAGGAHTDQPGNGEAPMIMAAAARAGNTTADARILQQIRYTLTGGNDITANGGYPSQHERHVTGMIAVVRHIPRIWNQLSSTEKSRVDLMMKASLIASAFTTSDTNPYVLARTGERALDGDSNIGRNWNPNYREGMVGGVLVAMAYFGGPDVVNQILNGYDHPTFVAQLKAANLANSYQTFNWKTANPWASAPTGDQIENAVRNYRYLGLPINNYMGIYWKLTENTFNKSVSAGLNGGAGISGYGRILSGADTLPNKGVLGMLTEFASSDANGARSSATYAYDGYRVNQTNQYVLIATGYWNKASAEAASSLARIRIGSADLWYKLAKGYSNYAKGASRGTDSLAETNRGFEFAREMWEHVLKDFHNIA